MLLVKNIHSFKLCLVTDTKDLSFSEYQQFIIQVVEGGVTLIQLRDKSNNLARIREMALALKNILKPFNVPFIINDHLALAKEIDADGVHLGQSDGSPDEARQLLGPDKIIGWSIESLVELERANQLTCVDYVAASAVFPSQTKRDCKTIWGLAGLRELARQSKHPVMAIGGIDASNVQTVMDQGVCGVAVISALHAAHDPKKTAQTLMSQINQSLEKVSIRCARHSRKLLAGISSSQQGIPDKSIRG